MYGTRTADWLRMGHIYISATGTVLDLGKSKEEICPLPVSTAKFTSNIIKHIFKISFI